jgi:hypothetical protein
MLSSYFDGSAAHVADAAEHTDRMLDLIDLRRARQQGVTSSHLDQVCYLMSATSTGALFDRISGALKERKAPIERINFVSLFALGRAAPAMPCLRDLSVPSGRGEFAPIEDASSAKSKSKIAIDVHTYFPGDFIDVVHKVRTIRTAAFQQFLTRYEDNSLVKVHHDDAEHGPLRHQAIWIDTEKLVSLPVFQARLAAELEKLDPPPKLIITPSHNAAMTLADFAKSVVEKRESSVRHFPHANLFLRESETAIRNAIEALGKRDSLLILDDAFITGTRISYYRNALRDMKKFEGRIHFMVAVARPEHLWQWRRACQLLSYRHPKSRQYWGSNTVKEIELFALPNWGNQDCPWCVEASLYRRSGRDKLSDTLRERLDFLQSCDGITSALFLKAPGVERLRYTPGSILAPSSADDASLFASIASGVQMMRSEEGVKGTGKPPLGPPHFPLATILDCEPEFFSDSLIKACMIRAAKPYELVYTGRKSESDRSNQALSDLRAEDTSINDIGAEIVLAALSDKFPALDLSGGDMPDVMGRLGLTRLFEGLLRA